MATLVVAVPRANAGCAPPPLDSIRQTLDKPALPPTRPRGSKVFTTRHLLLLLISLAMLFAVMKLGQWASFVAPLLVPLYLYALIVLDRMAKESQSGQRWFLAGYALVLVMLVVLLIVGIQLAAP